MSSHSRHNDRRYSSKSRDSDSSRRSNGGRSPSPPRKENELPVEFGRPPQSTIKEDENTLLRRMKTAFVSTPLELLYDCVENKKKIQVFTRHSREIRGVLTGHLLVFDKHWNMLLADAEEIYVKSKYLKTPFLGSRIADLPELKTKNRQEGKKEKVLEEAPKKVAGEEAPKKVAEEEAPKKVAEEEAPKKTANGATAKNKKEKQKREVLKRKLEFVLLRGDNVVTFSYFEEGITFVPPK